MTRHLFTDAILETDRLRIRPYKLEDVNDLHRAVSGPTFYDYIPGETTPSLMEVENIIKWSISCCQKNTIEKIYKFNLGITLKETQEFIGFCGLGPYDLDPKQIELYYGISEKFTGQGLATEAARAVLQFGFDELQLDEIVTTVHPQNLASRRILEKVGFHYKLTLKNLTENDRAFEGYDYYAITKKSFKQLLKL
ncbi:GNAT family N-acetyltransferase [Brevibacillus borstelensis]|uniref:GNAT family N-acetyltransferase n=1 Tax=Brevibacillus borstelensis TaxID=45462 RepID=UPI0030BAA61C